MKWAGWFWETSHFKLENVSLLLKGTVSSKFKWEYFNMCNKNLRFSEGLQKESVLLNDSRNESGEYELFRANNFFKILVFGVQYNTIKADQIQREEEVCWPRWGSCVALGYSQIPRDAGTNRMRGLWDCYTLVQCRSSERGCSSPHRQLTAR